MGQQPGQVASAERTLQRELPCEQGHSGLGTCIVAEPQDGLQRAALEVAGLFEEWLVEQRPHSKRPSPTGFESVPAFNGPPKRRELVLQPIDALQVAD